MLVTKGTARDDGFRIRAVTLRPARLEEGEGLGRFRIETDPLAAAFFEHMDATRRGTTSSQAFADRILPMYTSDLFAGGDTR